MADVGTVAAQRAASRRCVALLALGCGFAAPAWAGDVIIHSFQPGAADGQFPDAGVIIDGTTSTIYGVTLNGGTYGAGTVFSISSAGEVVLHSFGAADDGATPEAQLALVNGVIYGTTHFGGTTNFGTIFTIDLESGAYKRVHSFAKKSGDEDGKNPMAGLVAVGDDLYGTTQYGGKYDNGSIYRLTPAGKERVIYSFGGSPDGKAPIASLTPIGPLLYGTTAAGGTDGYGTVFEVSLHGTEKVLYSFQGGDDGLSPNSSLMMVNNVLYGTAGFAGAHNAGTVFAITRKGMLRVIHAFGASGDGTSPAGGLTYVSGTLYGTTQTGGAYGEGTVYSVSPTHPFKTSIVYSFQGGTDGANPLGNLAVTTTGDLYGVTYVGGGIGICSHGCGTVFSLTP
jgi:uncharacterized repeat protein (TIGR03803 family)